MPLAAGLTAGLVAGLAARRAAYRPRPQERLAGVLEKYARLVGSARYGAVCD